MGRREGGSRVGRRPWSRPISSGGFGPLCEARSSRGHRSVLVGHTMSAITERRLCFILLLALVRAAVGCQRIESDTSNPPLTMSSPAP